MRDDTEGQPTAGASRRRSLGAACAATLLAVASGRAAARPRPEPASSPGDGSPANIPLAIVTGGLSGTYVRVGSDLASVLESTGMQVLPVVTRGSFDNLNHLLHTRGVDAALVQADALADLRRRTSSEVARSIQYAAKLYDEEVHILARRDIRSIGDLANKKVNTDRIGSGTALTASVLFGALGLTVEATHDDQETALGKLRRGEIAALAYVAGKPVKLLARLSDADAAGLWLLPVPLDAALLDTYLPTRIAKADYPALVGERGVDTFAVGTMLAVYAWQPGTERYDNLARFIPAMFERLPTLQQEPYHPKWKDVSLRSQVPGWTRFAPAQEWVRLHGGGAPISRSRS